MFKLAMYFLLLLTAGFVGVGLLLPQTFEINRTVSIKAHPVRIILLVSQLDKWESWWPWNRQEAGARLTVKEEGSDGTSLSWSGRPAAGRLVLTKTMVSGVEYEVHFLANQRSDSGLFELQTTGTETQLSWRANGHFELPVLGGYLALLAPSMHGGMLEWGLANIKDRAEADQSPLNLYFENDQGEETVEKVE